MSDKIKIAIAGFGNVASTLIKGLEFYKNSTEGLWHPKLAGFDVTDVVVTGIFDIHPGIVGKKISDLVLDYKINSDLTIQPGISEDMISHNSALMGGKKSTTYEELVSSLKKINPDFLINLISSGMDKSGEKYAKASLEAGCSFLMPQLQKLQPSNYELRLHQKD